MSPCAGIVIAGLCSATAYASLAIVSRSDNHPPLPLFFGCLGVALAAWIWSILRCRNSGASCATPILLFAIVFRAIGFYGTPLYEDDFYRYLWDGYVFGTSGSPYGRAPSEFFGRTDVPPAMEEVLGGINNPDIPTIYGPVCQWTFLLGWWIAPGSLWPLKLIYLAADLGLMALVWRIRRRSLDLLLYAWCPLLIKEIAFSAHTDILAALLLFLAWRLSARESEGMAGLWLGAALAAKVTVLFAAPLILWRAAPRAWIACAGALTALYAPFAIAGATDLSGLRAFSETWEFNSFGFALLQWLLGPDYAKVASLGLYGVFCAFVCFRRPDWLRGDILLGVFFFLAPVVNPWYLILIAPFIAVHPSATGAAALSAVLLSYATAGNLGKSGGQFDHPSWVRLTETAVIAAGVLFDRRQRKRQKRT